MTLSEQDRIEIHDLINSHGHLTDAGALDRYEELFTPDVTYDVADFGMGALHGPAAIREAGLTLGDANPVGHHVTNVVITEVDDHSARVKSKGIGVNADGTTGSVVYEDIVTQALGGWKISYRKVSVRRHRSSPRQVLEQWRAAVIRQDADALGDLYTVDAVHEFPFTRPGLPSRLEGRDRIVGWVAEGWKAGTLKYEQYRTLAIHDTADPDTIIVEQHALGTGAVTGEFALPNLIVLTVRKGQIACLRDYVNVLAALDAIGSA